MNSIVNQHICPITYLPVTGNEKYSRQGLKKLSTRLLSLRDLPLSAEEQRLEARKRADKMSIQGIQPKLSAKLDVMGGKFDIVDVGGAFILKPQSADYPQLPENEDVTMRMAQITGIEVPLHGLIYSSDGSLTYFIKRFDRLPRHNKIAVEDFAQLSGQNRDTKYEFSMERLVPLLDRYCTFPVLEKEKLLMRVLFNFLTGNEDMHLKNFSVITRSGKTELAPANDFINSTVALKNAREEIALPIRGNKSGLTRRDLIDYYALERLNLNQRVVDEILKKIKRAIPEWEKLIKISFLTEKTKNFYTQILHARMDVLYPTV